MKHTFQSLLQYVEVMIQCVNLGVCRHYIHGIAVVVVKLLIKTRICSDTNSQRREASNESTREKLIISLMQKLSSKSCCGFDEFKYWAFSQPLPCG